MDNKVDTQEMINQLVPNLPALRSKVGISQTALANLIGISRQSYSAVEKGKSELSWRTCLLIIYFFDNNEATHDMLMRLGVNVEQIKSSFN